MYILSGCLFGFIIVMPFLVLLHELGHAMPHLLAGEKAYIILGNGERAVRFSLANLEFSISPFSFNIGFCHWKYEPNLFTEGISIASGPIVSLVCSIAFYYLGLHYSTGIKKFLLEFAMWFCLFQFIMTALPLKYPEFMLGYGGLPSDGYLLLRLFAERT